ncbi:MAG TPA: PAS domain-containing protein, partial [Solirubrobacteraceae bacterium]|nr:PAS domain-containing protein [Solirubrobacteraceae bacterium]
MSRSSTSRWQAAPAEATARLPVRKSAIWLIARPNRNADHWHVRIRPFACAGGLSSARRLDRSLLAALRDTVDIAVFACDRDARVTWASKTAGELLGVERLVGSAPEQWIASMSPRTASGLPLAREDLPAERALAGERVSDLDVLVRIDARDVLLSTSAQPLQDDRGRRWGAIVTFRDVTLQRRLEALERSARAER